MTNTTLQDAGKLAAFIWRHPANKGRRARAFGRAFTFQIKARLLGQRTMANIGSRSSIWAELHRTGGSKALYANPPDHPEMLVWKNWLRPGDLFVDVGANVGSYTIWAGDLGANVIAIEPAPDTCIRLQENVTMNGYPVEIIRAAASSSTGTSRFTTDRDCVNHLDPLGNTTVLTVKLDEVIGSRTVDGMKIDVEGFEIEVLEGCHAALAEGRIRLLQLEWNTASVDAMGTDRQPVADLLRRFGYDLYRPDRTGALLPTAEVPTFGPDVFAMRP